MGESVVSMVVPDSSEASGFNSGPLSDTEPPVVSLQCRLKALTTDKEAKQLDVAKP